MRLGFYLFNAVQISVSTNQLRSHSYLTEIKHVILFPYRGNSFENHDSGDYPNGIADRLPYIGAGLLIIVLETARAPGPNFLDSAFDEVALKGHKGGPYASRPYVHADRVAMLLWRHLLGLDSNLK